VNATCNRRNCHVRQNTHPKINIDNGNAHVNIAVSHCKVYRLKAFKLSGPAIYNLRMLRTLHTCKNNYQTMFTNNIFWTILTMVQNNRHCWDFGLWPSSGILKNRTSFRPQRRKSGNDLLCWVIQKQLTSIDGHPDYPTATLDLQQKVQTLRSGSLASCVRWCWVHLVRRPLFGLLYQPRMVDVESNGLWRWRITPRITGFMGLVHCPEF
jgi:hypothetical protein